MSRPILFICRGCEGGDFLYKRVKALRKAQGLKPVFRLEGVHCLDGCDTPCTAKLKGKKRSTYTRVGLRVGSASALVDAAKGYAALNPGDELPERALPGESAD